MRIRVDPYITQPKLCYSCFRFSYVANQCKIPVAVSVDRLFMRKDMFALKLMDPTLV